MSLALVAAALVVGCSSGVKLNEAPVSDQGAASTNGSQSAVAPVDLNATQGTAQGPVGVARIIYFDFDSYTVKPEFQSVLDAHARFLKSHTATRVTLEGNTDERGGREYNLALGQKRADAVRRALGLLGVPESQMEAVSFGKEKPAVQGSSEDAYAKNRRVELTYH
ncbi:MAG: peptidoglycan-associated lipoprotein [Comamonas sp. SCN 67-35]|uniref:peptidoglycan-associated lipoprotein Pal n=1 Tax=unclassified Comamonas TaxID=2638500 RepID=UPI00086CB987|nr:MULTISPECIES: peptidoglycan-associated lipoprotein Pal [unclassified Comamonas]MBN9329114.1 peptidoglycan-associated lipoprotein Pal [Comamonas sp.]ODU39038.1 MAG: peptidoglycan-associated lipoprotein [Comamonas sp. SCN 67-35]OJX02769.1 MAG: peptidoglycan-associated lipoprotein [Burkholderiales bacterium 66-26]